MNRGNITNILCAEDDGMIRGDHEAGIEDLNGERLANGLPGIVISVFPRLVEIEKALRASLASGADYDFFLSDGEFPINDCDYSANLAGVVGFYRLARALAPHVPFYVASGNVPAAINEAITKADLPPLPLDQIFQKPYINVEVIIGHAEKKFGCPAEHGHSHDRSPSFRPMRPAP